MSEANVRRLQQLLARYEPGKAYDLVIEDLEATLSTSRRNISNIMKSLSELGWVNWSPSVGRGKTSKLTVVRDVNEALIELITSELQSGRFTLITRLLESYGSMAVTALSIATECQSNKNQSDDHLLIAQYPWVDVLDPVSTYRLAEMQVIKSIYATLLRQGDDGEIYSCIAHTWEMTGNTITLWIRPDVICHDGQNLTADDVVYCIQRLCQVDGPVQHLFEQVKEAKVSGLRQVSLTLAYPNPLFLYALCSSNASIYRKRSVHFSASHAAFVGSGPFAIASWDNEQLTLKRHHQFFCRRALLESITLSSNGDLAEQYLSFNDHEGEKESFVINALSYLTANYRAGADISPTTLSQLMAFIDQQRRHHDPDNAVIGLNFSPAITPDTPSDIPQLSGRLVLTQPPLTLPILKEIAQWLHHTIRLTGLTLEILDLNNISDPSTVREQADMLFIEEIIEQPYEFGLYEWLLISSGLRFAYSDEERRDHERRVQQALASSYPQAALETIEQDLYQSYRFLPLFNGREEVYRTVEVQGIDIRKTGYSEFFKLWIAHNR
ncbi:MULTISPECIES: ABC transporter substrate-binding protein [unclassified Vibrio]|uniref:ABC transporter substrate-binding protein n=1 Tax=unclassified Vibrio TaxID=2614977 RepID=UPI001361ACEF|nr:ABC transporter substrate-binding protein [Vibrio sp. V36_P2S2PM302]NAX20619.1 ABC transporter substrate-binding protein [Vibrio sp. V39_P1S14PM300]NAX26607.1 ABC transporter substrate-binding protein [Vibrio sp. V38_P2S17PM301]NAX29505.1 ABC transporter substrate-binding protein [Vibrio sp. V37_P2S8PM304]